MNDFIRFTLVLDWNGEKTAVTMLAEQNDTPAMSVEFSDAKLAYHFEDNVEILRGLDGKLFNPFLASPADYQLALSGLLRKPVEVAEGRISGEWLSDPMNYVSGADREG